VILPPCTSVECIEVDPAKIVEGDAHAYALFKVSRDNKRDERKLQPFANLFTSTKYYYYLKQSELDSAPNVQSVIDAAMPYATAGERQVVLQTLQKRNGCCSVDEVSQLVCCLFTVSEEGDIVGGFLRHAREILRSDSAEQQQLLPWTTAMLSYIEGMPVPASKRVYKLVRSKDWLGPKTRVGQGLRVFWRVLERLCRSKGDAWFQRWHLRSFDGG